MLLYYSYFSVVRTDQFFMNKVNMIPIQKSQEKRSVKKVRKNKYLPIRNLENNVKALQTQVCDLQVERSSLQVRINGLPAKKDETNKDAIVVFEQLLSELDINNDECEFTDVYRIPAKKIPNKPLLRYEDRNIFFQSLKNLKELIKIQKFLSIKTTGIC